MEPFADADDDELDLRGYLAVLARRKWIVLGCVAVVVGGALAFSFLQTPIYRAEAEVLLQPETADRLLARNGGARSPDEAQVATEVEVMESQRVLEAATEELGFEPEVSIAAEGDTQVVEVSAEDPDPARATEVATTYAQAYVTTRRQGRIEELAAATEDLQAQINAINEELVTLGDPFDPANPNGDRIASLETRRDTYTEQLNAIQLSSQLARTGGAQVVSEAREPDEPVEPQPVRNAVAALVLGLLLGAGAAFGVDHLDDSIRSREDLDRASGGERVLGLMPRLTSWKNRAEAHLATLESPGSPQAESYRTLRTSLQFLGLERTVGVIQVTSPQAGDGKTTTLANLGVALAQAGQRVVLVDCDLRRPRLHEFFGLDHHLGFTSVLLGEAHIGDALQAVPALPKLAVLASGRPPPNPSELLSTPTARETLGQLASRADFVLVDSAPVLPVSDGLVLARWVDSTLVVTAVSRTKKSDARRTFELLNQIEAPVVGAVLNDVAPSGSGAYGGGYGYGYGYTEPTSGTDGDRRNGDRASRRAPWRRSAHGNGDTSGDRVAGDGPSRRSDRPSRRSDEPVRREASDR